MKQSILEYAGRTTGKILKRLGIGCSRCGWNEAPCDIHHIHPRAKGGTDDHSNLTYLCPNCHRLAHRGMIETFVTLAEQIGDRWREYVDEVASNMHGERWRNGQADRNRQTRNIVQFNDKRRAEEADAIAAKVAALRSSGIDFTVYGWAMKAAPIIGIDPKKVSDWVQRNDPELFATAFRRKSREQANRAA